jgi:predicted Zn finger-like uncharacterized protein
MKVVCDGCQAKYKLTDGRLAGRKLKFRCRKCGNTIVIDGAEIGQASPVGMSADTADLHLGHDGFSQDAVPAFEPAPLDWYLSINGEPYGPCTTEQMASMLGDGQVPWETYVWHEGYPDWKSAAESNTLVRAVAALSENLDHSGLAGPSALERESWVPNADGDRLSYSDGAHLERAGYVDADGDYAPDSAYDYDAQSREPDDRRDAEEHDRLSAESFAAGSSLGHDDLTKVGFVDPQTGRAYSGDDGSGLIDIRALSALAGSRRNPKLTGPRRDDDDHPQDDVFALRSSGYRELKGIDTLAPVDRVGSVAGKAVPLAILAGSALIAVAAFAAIYSSPTPTQEPTQESRSASSARAEQAIAPAPRAADDTGGSPDSPSAGASAASADQPAAAVVDPAQPPSVPSAKERRAAASAARAEAARVKAEAAQAARAEAAVAEAPTSGAVPSGALADPAGASPRQTDAAPEAEKTAPNPIAQAPAAPEQPAAAPSEPAATADSGEALAAGESPTLTAKRSDPAGGRSLDELLAGAVPESEADLDRVIATGSLKPGAQAPAEAPQADAASTNTAGLPPTPTREQVVAAMRAIEPDVRACTEGQTLDSQTAAASFSVTGNNGRVGSVRVTGIKGPVGSCVARAVRNAIFPPFAKSQLHINFPFRLAP